MQVYEKDGRFDAYCFVCETYDKNPFGDNNNNMSDKETSIDTSINTIEEIDKYPIRELSDRGLGIEVSNQFGVRVGIDPTSGEVSEHYYPHYSQGKVSGYKVRGVKDKTFSFIGNGKNLELFGQHQCGEGGKLLIITEGELDAMSASQMLQAMGKNYRVVSLPSGANARAIKDNLEWVSKFEHIILSFDQDKVGQKAARDVASLLPPGRCRIMEMDEKDANDMLLAKKGKQFYRAISAAKEFRPDGVVSGADTWEILKNRPEVISVPFPDDWELMNQKTYGMRQGELDTWTSGSGMGKSQIMRELQYHLFNKTEDNIGIIALEEPLADSVEALMGLHMNKRIQLPDIRKDISDDAMYQAWLATSGTNRFHYYDHFGSVEDNNLLNKIRYFAKGLDCKWIFLDHLSIVVSEFADEGNERERIDSLMTKLKNLTQELNIWIGVIVHLRKTANGRSFEEGAVPTLDDLRGSGSLKQLSNSVYALSRNQQAEKDEERNTSRLTVLKCRFTGRTGSSDYLQFNDNTGRMYGVEPMFEDNK